MSESRNLTVDAALLIDEVKGILDVVIAAFDWDNINDKRSQPPIFGVAAILTDCKMRLERSQEMLNV